MNNLSTLIKNTAISAGVAIAASTFFAATPADAFTMKFDPSFGTTSDYTGSLGELKFDFVDSGNGGVSILMTVANTTPSDIGSTLVGWTFDTLDWMDSLAWSYDNMGTDFTLVFEDPSYQPFGTFDFGVRSEGGNNRSFSGGKPTAGLREGESAQVAFTFSNVGKSASELESLFASAYESGQLRAAARFQQVGVNGEESDKVLAGYFQETIPPEPPSVSVPEPTVTLGLGMFALGALGAGRKNRKSEC
ncbi:PEP-CTERM sorting domain-containing protein [Spirulina subsalsa FACHB-351]|uniref:PEP-CTERM sorting domain-containing protein n=1 Tax=Spirulina subsalsa FACHB-351 TaxID=234711 RepID=A0ABT3L123_9CYAN|nr:PEP-CTERM sorting domain-containing protein [Spirulina subsalsa]MCW6034705.1 PEP-CTERM sorting domain-containing protein [Spirulina subsalsa FACHB-351]